MIDTITIPSIYYEFFEILKSHYTDHHVDIETMKLQLESLEGLDITSEQTKTILDELRQSQVVFQKIITSIQEAEYNILSSVEESNPPHQTMAEIMNSPPDIKPRDPANLGHADAWMFIGNYLVDLQQFSCPFPHPGATIHSNLIGLTRQLARYYYRYVKDPSYAELFIRDSVEFCKLMPQLNGPTWSPGIETFPHTLKHMKSVLKVEDKIGNDVSEAITAMQSAYREYRAFLDTLDYTESVRDGKVWRWYKISTQ